MVKNPPGQVGAFVSPQPAWNRAGGCLRRRWAVGGGRCTVGVPPRSAGAGLGRAVSGGKGSSPAWPDSVALGETGREGLGTPSYPAPASLC